MSRPINITRTTNKPKSIKMLSFFTSLGNKIKSKRKANIKIKEAIRKENTAYFKYSFVLKPTFVILF